MAIIETIEAVCNAYRLNCVVPSLQGSGSARDRLAAEFEAKAVRVIEIDIC